MRKEEDLWVVYEGEDGPGRGKHVVLISGDEEYRSEEAIPMLGKILAFRHGFRCTVLFSIDPETGEINPEVRSNIPGLHNLETADLMIIFTRFRELPDDQMRYIDDYVRSGRPIIGLRTATHAFRYTDKSSKYARYSFDAEGEWEGGFGRWILGETWVAHHGRHGVESTRGVLNEEIRDHPILRGVEDIWGPTDVYAIRDLPEDAEVLVYGQVLKGISPDDEPKPGVPLMPVAWIRTRAGGMERRVFCTTMGASVDFLNEGLRRLVVNACYWCLGMEDMIPERSDVGFVGEYKPTFFGFGKFRRGMRPADFRDP